MPIIDLEIVVPEGTALDSVPVKGIADALGQSFGSAPGRTWVRVKLLTRAAYAENGSILSDAELPVFATVSRARLPEPETLAREVHAVTVALATALSRNPERVHVQYAPAFAGRQAFGGRLVQ